MTEKQLRSECANKFTDDRYTDAVRAWSKTKLIEVYSESMDADRVVEIVNEEWEEHMGGDNHSQAWMAHAIMSRRLR